MRRSPRRLQRIQYYSDSSDDNRSDIEEPNTNRTAAQLSYTLPNLRQETLAGQPLPNDGNIYHFLPGTTSGQRGVPLGTMVP